MIKLDLSMVLLCPVISEKATMLSGKGGHVTLNVAPKVTKQEVKAAVESYLNVQVRCVQILNRKGKKVRGGRGRRSDIRRAYVALHPGQEITFSGVA